MSFIAKYKNKPFDFKKKPISLKMSAKSEIDTNKVCFDINVIEESLRLL